MKLAIALVAFLAVAAAANVLVGVYMLVGAPWVFIALGLMLFATATFIRAGLKSNG